MEKGESRLYKHPQRGNVVVRLLERACVTKQWLVREDASEDRSNVVYRLRDDQLGPIVRSIVWPEATAEDLAQLDAQEPQLTPLKPERPL
jgi:hypothetical protein